MYVHFRCVSVSEFLRSASDCYSTKDEEKSMKILFTCDHKKTDARLSIGTAVVSLSAGDFKVID